MKKTRRRYDRASKISVVAELESGKPLAQIARACDAAKTRSLYGGSKTKLKCASYTHYLIQPFLLASNRPKSNSGKQPIPHTVELYTSSLDRPPRSDQSRPQITVLWRANLIARTQGGIGIESIFIII